MGSNPATPTKKVSWIYSFQLTFFVLKDFDWHLCLTMQVECELSPNAFPVNFSPSCQFDIIVLYNIYEVKDIVIWVESLIVSLLFLI